MVKLACHPNAGDRRERLKALSGSGEISVVFERLARISQGGTALASQAGKPKGGCERDGCGAKKDFVAFLFIHHNVFEAL